jgi:hypothetical protein
MTNIIKNWKMRHRTTKSGPTRAAVGGVWHDDQFGFFAVGFAAMALEQIQCH